MNVAMSPRRFSIVGRSAAEYAAEHDLSERLGYLSLLSDLDLNAAIEVSSNKRWWSELDAVFTNRTLDGDSAYHLAQSIGATAPKYRNLFAAIVRSIPDHVAFQAAVGRYEHRLAETWLQLRPQIGALRRETALMLLKKLLSERVLTATDVVDLYAEVAPFDDELSRRREDDEALYAMLPSILEDLSAHSARRFFERVVDNKALVQSHASDLSMHDFVQGAGQNLYDCANLVLAKLSPAGGIAWSLRMMQVALKEDAERFRSEYNGAELSGPGHSQVGGTFSYQDLGWLMRVILPSTRDWLSSLSIEKHTQILRSIRLSPTFLHPSFRVRSLVLATPANRLQALASELVRLCEYDGGLPRVSDAVARRAKESLELASKYLRWAWKHRGGIYQPDESAILHKLIQSKKYKSYAREVAEQLVASERFAQIEAFHLGFFAQLNWVAQDPGFALDLITSALRHGYSPGLIDAEYIIGLLTQIAEDPVTRTRLTADPVLEKYLPYVEGLITSTPALATELFAKADNFAKMQLLREAEKQPLAQALEVVALGLEDPDPTPDSEIELNYRDGDAGSISGVRVTAYWTYLQLIQKFGITAYHEAPFDIFAIIDAESGAYAARYALMALQVILNQAAKDNNSDLATQVIDHATNLLKIDRRAIDEDVASFIVWWWALLPERLHELAHTRLSLSQAYLGRLMVRGIARKDESDLAYLLSRLPEAPRAIISWAAWFLWQMVNKEDFGAATSLAQEELQIVVDAIIALPDANTYANLIRLFADADPRDERFITSRTVVMIAQALESNFEFLIVPDLRLIVDGNEELVIRTAERAAEIATSARAYNMLSVLLDLVVDITDISWTKRVHDLFEALPASNFVVRYREAWLRKVSK